MNYDYRNLKLTKDTDIANELPNKNHKIRKDQREHPRHKREINKTELNFTSLS